mmetsp:Transcript_155093/g.497275  ORF Transcript_155093/g.497275 Transcript_155093/m.497275 type:complete len:260 (+) Transcript_155093:338-1117(+)
MALNSMRELLHDVQLAAGVAKEVPARHVRFRHALPKRLHVTSLARLHALEHTVVLRDDVAGALPLAVRELAAVRREHLGVDVAEVGDGLVARGLHKGVLGREAVFAELVILAVNEGVGGVRVGEHELGAGHGHVAAVEGSAVEVDQGARLAHTRTELIQDAAAHAHKVVLGRLGNLHERELVVLPKRLREEPFEQKGRGHLHSRRAGDPGTWWYVRGQEGVEAANLDAEFPELRDHPYDVVGPSLIAALLVLRGKSLGL